MTVLRERTLKRCGPSPSAPDLCPSFSYCSSKVSSSHLEPHLGLVPPGLRPPAQVRGLSSSSQLRPKLGWAPGSWAGGPASCSE